MPGRRYLAWRWPLAVLRANATRVRRMSRRGAVTALVALLLGVVMVSGVLRVRVDTSAESFLPARDPTLAAVREQARDFGGDPVIVLLRFVQPRQFVTDHDQLMALLKTEGQLAKLPDVATVYGPATLLNQLAGAAQNFLLEIAGRRDRARELAQQAAAQAGKPQAEVQAAGADAVARVDMQYAPLIVRSLPVGLPTLSNARFGSAAMFGADGLARPNWRFIVPDPTTVALLVRPRQDMDQAATARLVDAVRATVNGAGLASTSVTVSGVPTVMAELAEEVATEGPLIGALVAMVVLLRFLLVPARGRRWQRLRPLAATVLGSAATLAVFGWGGYPLSFAAVVLLPLLFGVGSSFPLYLTMVANRRRVVVMSLASAVSFLALGLSPLPFVQDLGVTLAVGVVLTVAVAMALNTRWPPPPADPPAKSSDACSIGGLSTLEPVSVWRGRAGLVRGGAVVAAVAVALVGWAALPRIAVSANPVDLARGLPAVTDAEHVESTLGASGEINVRLSGPDALSLAALRWADTAQQVLAERFGGQLRPVVGVPTVFGFLGPDATAEQINAAAELMPSYLRSAIVRPDRQVSLLVYGVKLQDLGAQQRMLEQMREALPSPPPGFRVDTVGLPVAAARGYQLMLADRYLANLAGIAVAGLLLALGLRRRWDAARAVGAALLATGWGLGAIWALGMALSPLTLGLGCLVNVTGCEFVVLLTEARRRAQAWLWRSVGLACLTSMLGYLALASSRLVLVREFGLVLGVVVVLSYLAAELVTWLVPPRTTTAAPPAGASTRVRAVADPAHGGEQAEVRA